MVRTGNKGTEIPLSLVVASYNGGPCRLCLSRRSCVLLSYWAMQGCGRRQNGKVTGSLEMAPPSQFVISFARFLWMSTRSGVVWRWELPQAFPNTVCFVEIHRASSLGKRECLPTLQYGCRESWSEEGRHWSPYIDLQIIADPHTRAHTRPAQTQQEHLPIDFLWVL